FRNLFGILVVLKKHYRCASGFALAFGLLLEFFRRLITQGGVQPLPIVILLDELFDVRPQMFQVVAFVVGVELAPALRRSAASPGLNQRPTHPLPGEHLEDQRQAKVAHTRVRMGGWRQRRLGETEKEKIMATEKTLARDRPSHGRTWAHVKLP